jgi:hypothetical protein
MSLLHRTCVYLPPTLPRRVTGLAAALTYLFYLTDDESL